MLERARQKSRAAALSFAPEFIQGDVRQVELGKTSDAALFMFAVLGYQLSNADVLAALEAVKRDHGLKLYRRNLRERVGF